MNVGVLYCIVNTASSGSGLPISMLSIESDWLRFSVIRKKPSASKYSLWRWVGSLRIDSGVCYWRPYLFAPFKSNLELISKK